MILMMDKVQHMYVITIMEPVGTIKIRFYFCRVGAKENVDGNDQEVKGVEENRKEFRKGGDSSSSVPAAREKRCSLPSNLQNARCKHACVVLKAVKLRTYAYILA